MTSWAAVKAHTTRTLTLVAAIPRVHTIDQVEGAIAEVAAVLKTLRDYRDTQCPSYHQGRAPPAAKH